MNKRPNAPITSESAQGILSLSLPFSLSHDKRDRLAHLFLLDCSSNEERFLEYLTPLLKATPGANKNNWLEWQIALKAWLQFAETLKPDDARKGDAMLILSRAHALLNEQIFQHNIRLGEIVKNRAVDLQLIVSDKHDQMNMIVHDLRNPLSAINLNLRLLTLSVEANGQERSIELIERLTRNTTSLKHLIEQLYENNSRADEGLMLSIGPFDLNQIAAAVVECCAVHAASKSIELNLVQSAEPAIADVDHSMLLQALENLISNAITFSSPDKFVYVSVEAGDDVIAIEVRDEGQGLSADELEKIFGRNQQVSSLPSGDESSTGLGLYIVQKLVTAMDGKISAESPGKDLGSTFRITLNRSSPSI